MSMPPATSGRSLIEWQFPVRDTKRSAIADIPSDHLNRVGPQAAVPRDSIKPRPAGKKAGVAISSTKPQVRKDDIEHRIACPARECQQRYLFANDISARARSLLDDAFRNQDAEDAMRRRAE